MREGLRPHRYRWFEHTDEGLNAINNQETGAQDAGVRNNRTPALFICPESGRITADEKAQKNSHGRQSG